VQGHVGDGGAAAEVQVLQLVTVEGQTLAGAVGDLLAVLQGERLDRIAVLPKKGGQDSIAYKN
jgi:hypothetical protein